VAGCGEPVAGLGRSAARDDAEATGGGGGEHLVDWGRTGRRLRRQALVLAGLVVVAWLAVGIRDGGLSGRTLAELAGFGVLLAVAAEIVIVGGAALRGMLVAGERGERLAEQDVSLLPPQVVRRLRRRG
jgi:hypothetical protein